jgi:hypothetical protein
MFERARLKMAQSLDEFLTYAPREFVVTLDRRDLAGAENAGCWMETRRHGSPPECRSSCWCIGRVDTLADPVASQDCWNRHLPVPWC